MLAVVCITLVITFRSSERLAAMFGLAVSATMLATDIVFYVVATRVLHWKPVVVVPLVLAFGAVDVTFVAAGLPKFLDGAWVPLVVAAVITLVALTWLTGRRAVARALIGEQEPIEQFLAEYGELTHPPKGTVVLLTGDPTGVPFVNKHRWLGPLIADEQIVLLTMIPVAHPYVDDADRVKIERVSNRFVRVSASFGYMEPPRLIPILRSCVEEHLDIDKDTTSFIYADPVILPKDRDGLPRWQRELFEVLQRLSRSLASELEINASRRVELGVDVRV
jgi:KUP system potassium uptake protein